MATAVAPLTEAQARYYEDLARLRGRRGELLELLLDERWHPNHECAEIGGLSFNDSIFALRKEGWIIESRFVKKGLWEFRLVGKGEPPTGHKQMSRPQHLVAAHYMWLIANKLGFSQATEIRTLLPEWMRAEPREWQEPVTGDTDASLYV